MAIFFLLVSESFSQVDSKPEDLEIEEKASLHFAKEKKLQGTASAKFAADYIDKYGVFPSDEDVKNFHEKWREARQDSLSKIIALHFAYMNGGMDFIRERLLIWELKKGKGLPDSTFTILMTKYFEANKEKAVQFCIQRWEVLKLHKSDFADNQDVGDDPAMKNYPYVSYLFEKLDLSEIIKILIHKNSLSDDENQKFTKLFLIEFKKEYPKYKLKEIYNYSNSLIRLDKIIGSNKYFISRLKDLL